MAIYRNGTASLDAAGKMTGTGTEWKQALSLIRIGATVIFLSGSKPAFGSIAEIISDTEINLIGTAGQTAGSGDYVILLSDSLTVDGLAQDIAETLRYYQSKETAVEGIVEAIEGYLNQAAASADAAKTSETNAGQKATDAAASASAAKTSETNAGQKATDAAASASAAKTSETNAGQKANEAAASASAAKTSETNAGQKANEAAASAQAAQEGAATVANKADKGANKDITSLEAISPGLKIRGMIPSEGTEGNGITIESSDPVGSSFGIANVGGGAAVFHNYTKPANGSGSYSDSLIGGYGSRPWTGNGYTSHSNTAIHFIMDGNASPTNHGAWTRILTCAKGATQESRRQTFAASNNGDLWIGYDVPMGANSMSHATFGGDNNQGWDGRGLKQVVGPNNEINLLTPANGSTSPSVSLRGTLFGGYAGSAKSATPGNSAMWISICGHDGSNFVGAAASMRLVPSSGQYWSSTNRGAGIIFSTTAVGSTTRADRWSISGDGQFLPLSDGLQSVGNPSLRLSAVYAVNGAIQTSDARLKTKVRGFTEDEIKAASAISKEIGFWKWKDKVKSEGEKARTHVGMTVQRAIEIMESFNLDPFNYGFICHDKWDEDQQFEYVGNDTNNPKLKVIPGGDRYSFRYDQLNLFIAKGFEARLSAIEEMMNK